MEQVYMEVLPLVLAMFHLLYRELVATGAIETVSAGGFEIDISERLGSVSATGAIGTVSPNIKEDISGVSATGAINTVSVNIQEDITVYLVQALLIL